MGKRFIIDSLNFVRNTDVHHGKILPAELERLREYLSDHSGEIIYSISGIFDEKGRPALKIMITGMISLCCQRCLGKLEHTLNIETSLLIARNQDEFSYYDEDISVDAILASPDIDALTLIEDEIILSLPISPRHEEDQCSFSKNTVNTSEITKVIKKHPFVALKSLKKQAH
ncbi:YceD family protein [Nitrosomonas sp. Is37]|uniref:YceD family protein n=1 Tax=Nitrosomonas sp. Is37 TaxID=3080535 RepID=UPI00294AD019|nr:YceD family protein [Nitrosomonas sp. Is37]MDV6343544.1 YceD family protein [Nitrosomonas sp. Is37]